MIVYEHKYQESDRYRLYSKWASMKQRCSTKTCEQFKRYGGRGIKVCDEWKNSFEAFEQWANENGFKPWLQIDRINNDGDYCPSNCRFVTAKENSNNKSTNRILTYNGIDYTVAEFSRKFKVRYYRVGYGLKKGMDLDQIIEKWGKR